MRENATKDKLRPLLALCGAALLLVSGAAFAQDAPAEIMEPSLPNNAQSPEDFQGAARPTGGQGSESSGDPQGSTSTEGPVSGYSGGDMIVGDPQVAAAYQGSDRQGPKEIPQVHVVQTGDTLWSVCDYYYRDPWMWPELWANNPSITNPHWIYPGDRIRMIGGKEGVAAGRRPAVGSQPDLQIAGGRRFKPGPLTIQQNVFIDDSELESAANVIGSQVEHAMLTLYDEIYLKGDNFKPQVGRSYSVYQVEGELRDGDKKLGQLVRVLGAARVKRINDKGVATAEIIAANDAIYRSARVGPLRRSFRQVRPQTASKDLDGRIVGHVNPTQMIGAEELVYINRGREDGVQRGNRFLVVRRGDGNRKLYHEFKKDNADFPEEVVAEVAVLDVREQASVGLVTQTLEELRKGDKVRMRRGY